MTNLLETFEMKIEQKKMVKVVVSMPVTDKSKATLWLFTWWCKFSFR